MRHRRGNYSLFFAMLLPLLLGFMALAIDIGRLRVARVQVQGAADAAALEALAQLRAGGGHGDAADAAEDAANAVRMQSISDAGQLFDVDLTYGDWDFADQSWSGRSGSLNAVTVDIDQNTPLNFLFAPIFETGGFASRVYESGVPNDGAMHKSLHMRRRASLRPRDVVFVIDASQESVDHLDNLHAALGTVITAMHDLRLADDRVAIVEFAGDAIVAQPLASLDDNFSTIYDELTTYGPCSYDTASWYYFYRFFAPTELAEMRENAGFFEFNPIQPLVADGFAPVYRFEAESPSDEMTQFILDDAGLGAVATGSEPDFTQQCAINWASNFMFLNFFNRMADPDTGEPLFTASELMCYHGHPLAGQADRYDEYIAVPEVLDCDDDMQPLQEVDGISSYAGSDDGDPGYEHMDPSYQEAGVNPATGLLLAADILTGAGPTRNEPTIILVTTSGPRSGPDMDIALDAQNTYETATMDAVDVIDAMKANLHVLAVTPVGSADEDFLSGMTTGRGIFHSVENSLDLSDYLEKAGRDIRIQMVE